MNDNLGDRMKCYEDAYRIKLPRRMPIILRVDGKSFHTLTRHCTKPFDLDLVEAMQNAARHLYTHIQGAQIAYVQSDEISVLIHNYKTFKSEPWFDNGLQKMVSVAASIAGAGFNGIYESMAHFDARAFVLPESEVCNYFIWRQQDATRNSIQMLARSLFSNKECHKKNTSQLQEMCFQKGHNWNELPTMLRRGSCYVDDGLDVEIPVFTQDREYITRHLDIPEVVANI